MKVVKVKGLRTEAEYHRHKKTLERAEYLLHQQTNYSPVFMTRCELIDERLKTR